MKDGLIMMGDLPRKSDGLIVMGDLPKERWWSHYDGWPTQIVMMMRAQRHTRKEVGLENALPERLWLKGALEMR